MVVTRSQLAWKSFKRWVSRQLRGVNQLLPVENIEDKLEHLNKQFNDFLGKFNELHWELQVSKNCSKELEKMHLVQHSTLEGK